jgi:Protein of unknown function (DUF3892)
MPRNVQIECVRTTGSQEAHERISHVGGRGPEGLIWTLSQAEAIAHIESGEWNYFVSMSGKMVWVVIDVSESGYKYLKTQADDRQPAYLLNLPEAPYDPRG